MKSISRRSFLRQTGLITAAGALPALGQARVAVPNVRSAVPGEAKVIFLVSDGMSSGVLPMAERLQRIRRGTGTRWMELLQVRSADTYTGWMDMSSATGSVTDSAAASSSWGTGQRGHNGQINIAVDGTEPEPILVTARKHGLRGGVVTTARVTHATPAGFVANMASREMEDDIAVQYLQRGFDVMLGGGRRHFSPERRADQLDLIGRFAGEGYAVVTRREQLLAAKGGAPLLGLFGNDHLPYTVDHVNDATLREQVPTLAEMTQAALGWFERAGGGFLLQVEGARVDHGAHANDTPASLFDQLAFDDAIAVALAFRERHPETVILLTSDHGNANPGFNGYGPNYRRSDELFANVAGMTASYEQVVAKLNPDMTEADVQSAVQAFSQLEISPTEAAIVLRALRREPVHPYRVLNGAVNVFSAVLANHTSVGWTGSTHTADYSPLVILGGPNQSLPPFLPNTALYSFLRDLLG